MNRRSRSRYDDMSIARGSLLRVVAGCLLAPLMGGLSWVAFETLFYNPSGQRFLDLLGMGLLAALYALSGLSLGIPMYLVFRRFGIVGLTSHALGGFAVGTVIGCFYFIRIPESIFSSGVAGAVAAVGFWRIVVR